MIDTLLEFGWIPRQVKSDECSQAWNSSQAQSASMAITIQFFDCLLFACYLEGHEKKGSNWYWWVIDFLRCENQECWQKLPSISWMLGSALNRLHKLKLQGSGFITCLVSGKFTCLAKELAHIPKKDLNDNPDCSKKSVAIQAAGQTSFKLDEFLCHDCNR